MELDDLMDSDQRLLAHSKRVAEGGQTFLVFDWGDDRPPLRGLLPDNPNAATLMGWCATVRDNYRAWKDSQEVEAIRKAATVRPAHEQSTPDAEHSAGGGGAVQEGEPPTKEAVLGLLEARHSKLVERLAALHEERDEISRRVESLERRASQTTAELMDVEKMMEVIKCIDALQKD